MINMYREIGIVVFWFLILFYIVLYILIRIIEYFFRKLDKRLEKKEKNIKIYCEILKSNECKFPKLQCGKCKIWIKNIRKEYLKSMEYKLFKAQKLNFIKRYKIRKYINKND